MAGEIGRLAPDVIHVHWTQLGHALAAADSGIPFVITAHDAALECAWWNLSVRPAPLLAGIAGVASTRCALRKASRIIAVSPHVASHVRRFYLRTPGASPVVDVVPNPLGVLEESSGGAEFPPAIARSLEGSRFVFLAAGYWGKLKGLDVALRAFGIVRQRISGATLFLAGKDLGPNSTCENWARSRGLAEGVIFGGGVSHGLLMRIARERAHCLVHPARTEGFGLVVAEAMAMGVPVIASASGSLPWLLDSGNAGTLVESRGPEEWAAAMEAVARGEGGEETANARTRVAGLCDPERIAGRHAEIYREVTG